MKRASKVRALIVDDEPFARERVRQLLAGDPDVEIIGECGDGLRAAALINERAPDLLFLDVQMPELDGFGVLERIEAERMPVVIFVTAYDKYAIRAFEACALDYLLKPYDEERFAKALGRAKTQLGREAPDAESAASTLHFAPAGSGDAPTKYLERVVVKAGGRVYFFRTEEIDWVEAQGNYVRLHIGRAAYSLRETISSLEQELDPNKFARIHRGTLVNVERIKELQPMFHGQHAVILRDGTELTLSRRHRGSLEAAIGRPI